MPKMLVLADIERLSPDAQACLDSHLGGIGAPDAAVVATTALAPEHLARVAGFRRDLWLRFSVHPVCLAPLSSRRADIPLLADAMASAIAERWRIRRPALADRATDELVAAALSGNLTEPETALASAIPAAPPSQPPRRASGSAGRNWPIGSTAQHGAAMRRYQSRRVEPVACLRAFQHQRGPCPGRCLSVGQTPVSRDQVQGLCQCDYKCECQTRCISDFCRCAFSQPAMASLGTRPIC